MSKKERIPGSVKIRGEKEEDRYSLWNNLVEPRAHLWESLLKGLSTRGLRVKGNEASKSTKDVNVFLLQSLYSLCYFETDSFNILLSIHSMTSLMFSGFQYIFGSDAVGEKYLEVCQMSVAI